MKLLQLALGLDSGSYFASQADIILYVLRLGRVQTTITTIHPLHDMVGNTDDASAWQ